ncbi:serine/threonine protein phosphatase 1 [Chitinophaga rupis]|uniref:Serine/threonine protein phosphatase 1 n=1 Tax=Chitinophaga rupis TaxID=573321 RepID=A0A1H8C814_9BACT|nr:metallophosphoesterase [Chitinophaga rupis]SEM91180.1 serine/threonine protein phosphatase 1 [Chitinophaga rupis]
MRTLVMGDIHGAYKALSQCLQRCSFDLEKDTLIQLGDVVDGYPEAYECVEALLEIKHLIALKGNHDDWLDTFIKTEFHPVFWKFGGKGTLISYLSHAGKERRFFATGSGYKTALVSNDIPSTHKAFFNQQRLFYIDDKQRCVVHAGFNRHMAITKQKAEDFYWDRTLWSEAIQCHKYYGNAISPDEFLAESDLLEVYIGHTPTTQIGTDKPSKALNIYNIDTGAGHSGRLTILDIATKQYWQSDPLPELYPQNFRERSFNI